jgi:hypothetical protein
MAWMVLACILVSGSLLGRAVHWACGKWNALSLDAVGMLSLIETLEPVVPEKLAMATTLPWMPVIFVFVFPKTVCAN